MRSFHRNVRLREREQFNRYKHSKFAAEQILKVKFPIKLTNAMKAFGRARDPFRKRGLEKNFSNKLRFIDLSIDLY